MSTTGTDNVNYISHPDDVNVSMMKIMPVMSGELIMPTPIISMGPIMPIYYIM